ncbi:MAG TPA: sigma-70 family RNA polymerase sigma factor [Thermoanaerobaculia bacterium]|nr:sigma-70 family RNA polymerase sigma factor [Thermoanaerobaculia bacterium]
MEERLLIEAAQKDSSRFAELYEANFDRVYAFVARRVRNRQEAQDLTSDVFHRALANLQRFEWRGAPFAAWLYRMAANAVADHYQEKARAGEFPAQEVSDDAMADAERRASLAQCVDRLPKEQRRVIAMRFVEQRSIREIAQDFGKSEGAIKQLQWRALQNLRAQMHG